MKKIVKAINREYDNHFLPFLWMHGEDHQIIGEYLEKISDAGIQSICIESRPYENFLEEQWWSDLSFIIKECKKLNMTVWVLDDKHFPTGYAAGVIEAQYPHLQKQFLAMKSLDFVGPREDAEILLDWLVSERPNIMNVGTEVEKLSAHSNNIKNEILGIFAAKKTAYSEIDEEIIIDLSEYMNERTLFWSVPEGEWTIFALYTIFEGGEEATKGYLNPLVKESTQVLIDTVYEPHYKHFGKEFGKTIAGFFSDEPRFGNVKGPNASIGRQEMQLSWRKGLEVELAEKMRIPQDKIYPYLLLLFTGENKEAHEVRYQYMNLVSQLYSENFSEVIGEWCNNRNVEYIGHVIEDNNAHARLGYGAGHFFRSMAGQQMSGIDVVLHQLIPRQNNGLFKSYTSTGWDGEFFTYGLAKLGSSLGQLDPQKKGRTMCEVYGAYGWSEGLRLMKWITDHMLVNGVNYFVPHAFTMKKFPDPDCPPHFYAHGHNMQFPYMNKLIEYVNRISYLLSEGKFTSSVGVLYHAEAEWSGDYMLFQKPARTLTENQIGFNIVSADMLTNQALIVDSKFVLNEMTFNTLIIPYSERLPIKLLNQITRLADKGVSVIFVDGYPLGTSENITDTELFEKIKEKCKVSNLSDLNNNLRNQVDQLEVDKVSPYLRYYHYTQKDGEIFMLFNEDLYEPLEFAASFPTKEDLLIYNPIENRIVRPTKIQGKYQVYLDRGETLIFYTENELKQRIEVDEVGINESSLNHYPWSVEIVRGYGLPERRNWNFDKLPNLTKLPEFSDFSGELIYKTYFESKSEKLSLNISDLSEIATVRLNGEEIGTKISYPYNFDLSEKLRVGKNELEIAVINNLGRHVKDYLSQYLYLDPVGISGSVTLIEY